MREIGEAFRAGFPRDVEGATEILFHDLGEIVRSYSLSNEALA